MQARNIYLDLLRGVACLFVILFHYTVRYDELFGHIGEMSIRFPNGGKAVALFFILSGYFAASHTKNTSVYVYAVKRFFRMYPVYWVAIIITFPLVTFFLPSRSVSFFDAIVNFTMMQGFLQVPNVDGAYWTLFHELRFYIIVGLVLLLNLNRHIESLCIVWIMVRIVTILLPDVLIFNHIRQVFSYLCIGDAYGHMFIAGTILAMLEREKFDKKCSCISKLRLIFSLLGCLGLQFYAHDFIYGFIFMIWIILICVGIVMYRKKIQIPSRLKTVCEPAIFVASISYPLYLIHQNLGYIIIKTMEKAGLTNEVFLLIPIAIVIGLAYLMHRYIEKPCAKISARLTHKN